jgi:hypothetical protein
MTNTNSNQIIETSDYSHFKIMKGNRCVDMQQVSRLMNSIKEKNLMHIHPIIVNKAMEIIDGQHRFMACQKLNIPVFYIVQNDLELRDVQLLNQNAKNWDIYDYLESYIAMKIPVYIAFKYFITKHNISAQTGIALLGSTSNDNYKGWDAFRKGNFIPRNPKQADTWMCMINDFQPFYEKYKRRSFIAAMIQIFKLEGYDHKQMLHKLSLQPTSLVDCTTSKNYVLLLEKIYNHKSHSLMRFM